MVSKAVSDDAGIGQRAGAVGDDRPGVIPFRLCAGITGHRKLPPGTDWGGCVTAALRQAWERLQPGGVTPLALTIVSSLAEGSDRIAADALLEWPAARLEVPLPLREEDYLEDFPAEASRADFLRLLGQAAGVAVPPRELVRHWRATQGSGWRAAGYEWAGRQVISRSDVIIALWDGQPARGRGGTGEIVDLAVRHRRVVVHIDTTRPGLIRFLDQDAEVTLTSWPRRGPRRRPAAAPLPALAASLRELEAYNAERIAPGKLAHALAESRRQLMGEPPFPPAAAELWSPIAGWVLPHYAKAEVLAKRTREAFLRFVWLVHLLPVAAIAAVAIQLEFQPGHPGLIWIEVGVLLGALAVIAYDRRRRWHESWISCRHFAERLRAAFFLAALDARRRPGHSGAGERFLRQEEADLSELSVQEAYSRGFNESSAGWLPRAFAEIWRSRPLAGPADVAVAKEVLAGNWLAGQIAYHRGKSRRDGRLHRLFMACSLVLFSVTLAAAALHAGGVADRHPTMERLLVAIAITLPALGAAVTGISHQLEFRSHAERSERIHGRLLTHRARLEHAETLAAVRQVAEEIESIMIGENRAWFDLMQARGDIEPPM